MRLSSEMEEKVSTDTKLFIAKCWAINVLLIGSLIPLIMAVCLGLTMSSLGIIHMEDCEIEPNVPLFLTTSGFLTVFDVVLCVSYVTVGFCRRDSYGLFRLPTDDLSKSMKSRAVFRIVIDYVFITLGILLLCASIASLIFQSVFVYTIETKELSYSDRGKWNFCEERVYKLSFYSVTTNWVLIGFGIFSWILWKLISKQRRKNLANKKLDYILDKLEEISGKNVRYVKLYEK